MPREDGIGPRSVAASARGLPGLEFAWDPARHAKNLRTRGIGFDAAAPIFAGEPIAWSDIRTACGEVRINAIGDAGGKTPQVTCAMRGAVVRIIPAWRANRKDRNTWATGR